MSNYQINLLEETIEDIEKSGHQIEDVIFIGSLETGHSCTWEEFKRLADFEYDCSFGSQKIGSDLIIAFSDKSHMWRHEYDGSESWKYTKPIEIPKTRKPIKCLAHNKVMWATLQDIENAMLEDE